MRGNVRRGLRFRLLRSYRLGHAWLWDEWSHALQERVVDSASSPRDRTKKLGFMFAYVDKSATCLSRSSGTSRTHVRGGRAVPAPRHGAIWAATSGRGGRLESTRIELRRHLRGDPCVERRSAVRGLNVRVVNAAAILGGGDRSSSRRVPPVRCMAGIVRPTDDGWARGLRVRRPASWWRSAGRPRDRGLSQLSCRGAAGRARVLAGDRPSGPR